MVVEAKTIEKHIDCGKWKLGLEGGYIPTEVRLRGSRNRTTPLRRLPKEEFRARFSYDPDGKVKDDVVLRGMPLYWHFEGNTVQLWPAPSHQWDVEIDLQPKPYSGC